MRLDVATSDSALAALWHPWQALWRQTPEAPPFLSPLWLQSWWDTFGTAQPVVATAHAGDQLLAVLPLYRLDEKLLPIGVGISDYTGILLHPDAPLDLTNRLLQAALDAGQTNRCDLPDLPPASPLLSALPPHGWTAVTWPGPTCPVLPLTPEPAIPKSMRRDIRQARHRANRASGWSIETASPDTFRPMFGSFVRLHTARWTNRSEAGALADSRVITFHQAAGPRMIEHGLLRLQALRLGNDIAAVIYALLSPGRILFYLSGFDPAHGFESPGTILLAHMIEHAAREGRREADFLRGNERYKYAWGCIDRSNTGLTLTRA